MPNRSSSSIEDVEAEYREPDPVELRDFKSIDGGRAVASYYRCGYLIEGANPQMISKFERIKSQAEAKARDKAMAIAKQLKQLGAPAGVSWWVQKWTTTEQVTLETADVVAL